MEELDLENILDQDQLAALFNEEPSQEGKEEKPQEKNNEETTEVDPDDLFGEEPEKVGGEQKNTDQKKENPDNPGGGFSPNNLYSSMTGYLVEEGVLSNLSEEEISNVKSAQDWKELVKKQIESQLDDTQKRINEALNADVEPSEIKKYEQYLANLNNLTEDQYTAEGEQGENLRRNIIIQDFINKGFSQQRAQKMAEQSFAAGKDIEDAKEALQSIKDTIQGNYDNLIKQAKEEKEKEEEADRKQLETLKKSILEDNKVFGELEIDKPTRQKVLDSITKVVYTDPKTKETFTALEKFENDDKIGFLKFMGLCYALTDGGKDLTKLVQGKVKKEVSKHLSDLESVLNNTQRDSSGNLRFINHSESKDDDSHYSGWSIDL